jgi:hypothetical protein
MRSCSHFVSYSYLTDLLACTSSPLKCKKRNNVTSHQHTYLIFDSVLIYHLFMVEISTFVP